MARVRKGKIIPKRTLVEMILHEPGRLRPLPPDLQERLDRLSPEQARKMLDSIPRINYTDYEETGELYVQQPDPTQAR